MNSDVGTVCEKAGNFHATNGGFLMFNATAESKFVWLENEPAALSDLFLFAASRWL